jgi:hypothetical protein
MVYSSERGIGSGWKGRSLGSNGEEPKRGEAIAVDDAPQARLEHSRNGSAGMTPLYLARIEDLRHGDLVKVDCAACHHVALLTPEFLLRLGLSPQAKVLDLKTRVRCRGCGAKGRAVVAIKWRREVS